MYNRLILVAGASGSGTSLFAGILAALGCHVPQPEAGGGGEPKGFGEPQWVANFHTKLLRKANVHMADARPSSWAQTAHVGREATVQSELEKWIGNTFNNNDHVVIRDPRLAWFLPAWRRAGETVATPCFVTVLRHPVDVIGNREPGYSGRWNNNALTAGWINAMLYTERATRGDRRAFVRYDDLQSDAMLEVSRISEYLDLELVDRPMPAQMRVATSLVDPAAGKSRSTWESLEVDRRLVDLAESVMGVLGKAAGSTDFDAEEMRSELDVLRQTYVDLYRFAASTAQFSMGGGRGGGGGSGQASNGSLLSSDSMRQLFRRARRKSKRTVHQLKEGRKTEGAGEGPSDKGS